MKIDNRDWIPVIGMIYAAKNGGFLFFHKPYLQYQMMCLLCASMLITSIILL